MPYKHIAAHLNKTELACRLHFHQLSHGNARRKRRMSCSSGSSDPSPHQGALSESPVLRGKSRSLSPPMNAADLSSRPFSSDRPASRSMPAVPSPGQPAILPKPETWYAEESTPGYILDHGPPPLGNRNGRFAQLPPVTLSESRSMNVPPVTPLRLELGRLSPPSASLHTPAHVDLARLRRIYESHRDAFWYAIAEEYGGSSPVLLERAWKVGACCQHSESNPMTPMASPGKERKSPQDKTSISSILGEDLEPLR